MTSEAARDIRPDHKVVLIKIPRSAPVGTDAAALLEATSKWWVVAESRRNDGPASPDYALAVNKGRVVAAYRIAGWRPAPTGHRWGFTGALSDELTALYGGLDVTRYFPPGAANPLRYVNCDTPKTSAQRATAEVVELQRAELREVVRRLDRDPLTHLMLGHRELFHSNLLAWFFRRLPEPADHVFGSLTSMMTGPSGGTREVLREKNSLDLWFRWPQRRPLVIENKVFSLPDEKQLEGYAAKAAARGDVPLLWLLSLSDPSWTDNRKSLGGYEWRWLSYRDLAERIRSALPPGDRSYDIETMRHYADVVDLLSDLVAAVVVTDANETVALPFDVRNALGDDRLTSTMSKLRARSVAQRVSQALQAAGIAHTEVEASLTNALPLNSWFGPIGRAPGARVGWQLQGAQFRLAVITPHLEGRSVSAREKRYEFAKANEDLFDFAYLDEILGTAGSATLPSAGPDNPSGFNRYDPDFVYRYKPAGHLTVAQLEAAAVAVARRIS